MAREIRQQNVKHVVIDGNMIHNYYSNNYQRLLQWLGTLVHNA